MHTLSLSKLQSLENKVFEFKFELSLSLSLSHTHTHPKSSTQLMRYFWFWNILNIVVEKQHFDQKNSTMHTESNSQWSAQKQQQKSPEI